jgi:hypothetical protein
MAKDVTLRLRGLDGQGPVRVHIEHHSGAALIAPSCELEVVTGGYRLSTTGFDGTSFRIDVDEAARTVKIEASAATGILGGGTAAVLERGEDIAPAVGLRASGDEPTMPIIVKKD